MSDCLYQFAVETKTRYHNVMGDCIKVSHGVLTVNELDGDLNLQEIAAFAPGSWVAVRRYQMKEE